MRRLELEDLFLIAEVVFQEFSAERIAAASDVAALQEALNAPFAAVGGFDFYPGKGRKVAVLALRLKTSQGFPDGNSAIALLAMGEFLERSDLTLSPPENDPLWIYKLFREHSLGAISDEEFLDAIEAAVQESPHPEDQAP